MASGACDLGRVRRRTRRSIPRLQPGRGQCEACLDCSCASWWPGASTRGPATSENEVRVATRQRGPSGEAPVPAALRESQGADLDPVDQRCTWPAPPRIIREDGAAVLLEWRFRASEVYSDFVVPSDSAYLAFRAAVRADGADLRRPEADAPRPDNEAEAANWRDEDANHELAQSGEVGTIEPIGCLDALLFAFQNSRVSELTHPTEFLASVLRRRLGGQTHLAVVFGAGREMFVPKSVYGLDVVAELVAEGWEYWYAIHNHTLQRNGDRLALGNPTLSISDVQLVRNLARDQDLQSARVTNGLYTFRVPAAEFPLMRSR